MDQQEHGCKKHDFLVLSASDSFMRTCLSCGLVEDFQPSQQKQQVDPWEGWLTAEIQPLSWPPCVQYSESIEATSIETARVFSHRPNVQTSFQNECQRERNPYVYSDLPKGSCIRLLELSPGNRLEVLSGRLFEVWWEQETCPSYSALSYTWADESGSTSPSNLIFLDKEQRVLRITRNCDRALRSLRHKTKPKLLWVDSICINQSSVSERSHQVSLMKNIYSRATTVHSYVGETACGDDLTGAQAMNLLSDLQVNGISGMLSSGDPSIISILNRFFARSYFSRLWIVQELLLAQSVTMHCGEVSLKITDESISQLYEQGVKVPSWVRFAGRARFNTERAPLELRDLLAATSGCQVTDLRDKVFGLLGLVSNHQASDLSPNYELMVREVYIGVAAYLVQKAHCCDLIQYADSGNSVYGIPSWVPMWNTDMPLQAPQGISRHIQQIEFDSKSLLKEEGLIDCFTIRSIEGWPHDECSQCNRKYCKLADSDSGFLSTRIETVLRLDSSYQPVFTVSTKLWPLEPGEYFTHFWYREDGLKIAVRTFGWALRDTKFSTGIHLIRVEGCTTLFLAHQTSDSRHYRLVASCVAAIVCPTRESRPIETLKPDDLQRCLQFMPLTVEMIKFIAEWKKEILDMAISGTGNMENALPFDDEHSDYSSGDEPEISDQSWKSWIPFLGLEDRKVLEEDEELQKQLPDLIDFWHKAHKLYTAVRQWTKSALDVSDHVRSIFRFAYPGVVLKDLLRNSKKLGRIFKRITGKKVVVFKSLPTLRLLLDLSDNHQDGWATVYPHLLSALEEDQQFFDKPFPLDLEEKHPKYSSIKETIEWKAVLEGLVRNNVEEKEICFV